MSYAHQNPELLMTHILDLTKFLSFQIVTNLSFELENYLSAFMMIYHYAAETAISLFHSTCGCNDCMALLQFRATGSVKN